MRRLKGFKNPYKNIKYVEDGEKKIYHQESSSDIFEDGADAMLEALIKQPTSIRSGGVTYSGNAQTPELAKAIIDRAKKEPIGTWVFIPDDEPEVKK